MKRTVKIDATRSVRCHPTTTHQVEFSFCEFGLAVHTLTLSPELAKAIGVALVNSAKEAEEAKGRAAS